MWFRLMMNIYMHIAEQEQAAAIARLPGLSWEKSNRTAGWHIPTLEH